ncbi:MAG TPA: efflux RND transporter periplasmic adaptor subunit [Gallionella sp.]|nr:efflux RND transporter periplasmic adaptor subunit [Gallionella sp.]
MSNQGRTIKIIAVLALLAAGAWWLLPSNGKGAAETVAKPTAKAALTVRAVQLAPAQWAQTLAANGSVVAWQEAVIGAELSGLRIAEVKVNVGDRVRRGDLLATLAADTQQATAAESRAALAESEAQLAEAIANAERARKLRASGFISEQQVIQATTVEQAARARVEVRRAKLQADTLRVAQARIVAPDAGILSVSNATVGTLTQPGAELFRLIRQGRLEWRAELTADELARVRKGMAVELSLAEGRIVHGKVRAVAPAVDAKTRYGQVLVELPDNAGLVAGQFTRGMIRLGEGKVSAQTLPQSAVVLRDGAAYVFVITPDSKVQERKVVTGARLADRVEITSGLSTDTPVVETGGAFLADGDVVRVTKAAQ